MRRIFCLLLCILMLLGANSIAKSNPDSFYECSNEQILNLTTTPSFIEKAGVIRHCHFPFAIYYHDLSTGTQREYCVEVFNTNGNLIFSKTFTTIQPEKDPVPYAQVYYDNDLLHCEYYPDIATMEEYYYYSFTTNGTVVTSNKRVVVKQGEAFYKENIGDYLVSKQAHLFEDDSERRIEIRNCFSGKSNYIKTTEFFCTFGKESEGILFFAQMEGKNIEIRQYFRDEDQPKIFNIKIDLLQNYEFSYVRSIATKGQTVYILIRLSNTQYYLLEYDLKTNSIIANREFSTAVDNDYTRNFLAIEPSLLAFVDVRWDNRLQNFRLLPYAYGNDRSIHELLPTIRTILSFDVSGNDSQLLTLEMLSPQWKSPLQNSK